MMIVKPHVGTAQAARRVTATDTRILTEEIMGLCTLAYVGSRIDMLRPVQRVRPVSCIAISAAATAIATDASAPDARYFQVFDDT